MISRSSGLNFSTLKDVAGPGFPGRKDLLMPTYHYACENCENEFELEQKISDKPRKRCPACRGKVFRVIHPVGHILKGSGFYKTDYRSEDFSKRELAEKSTGGTDKPSKESKKAAKAGKGK